MPDFTPTEEQLDLIEFVKSSDENLIVQALAGAAKTSSLVLLAQALRRHMILCLAFNKKIAVEMGERLPGNCESMTLNSLGHRVWAKATGRRLQVDARKDFTLLKGLISDLPKNQADEAWDDFTETLAAIDQGKTLGYIPTGSYPQARGLYNDEDFFAILEREPSALQERLIRKVTELSIKQGLDGRIDFNDQIILPTVFPTSFPQFPVVMIDEAQDLSDLNHATLKKLARKRLIAVGDPCQAIYGFRGANENSMEELERAFAMTAKQLTISFRCPQAVVREARWRAPQMQWPDWAAEGVVEHWKQWDADDVPPACAVICRNNAPLFSMAVRLLKQGRAPKILGSDFTKGITKAMKKLGETHIDQEATLAAIDKWEQSETFRARNPARIVDKADCFRIFASHGDTLGAAIAYAEHVLNVEGPIQLMTGHKSKGLEFNDVIFLDEHLVRDEGQDPNLRYVIQTRAKQRLIYATSEKFVGGEDD